MSEDNSVSRRNFLKGIGGIGLATHLGVETRYEDDLEESLSELGSYVRENAGYGYDMIIPEEVFNEHKDELYETDTTVVTDYWPDATVYRDENKYHSVQVSDYRGVERESLRDEILVGHLEFFNPDRAPVRHALTDYLLWNYKNRIVEDREL